METLSLSPPNRVGPGARSATLQRTGGAAFAWAVTVPASAAYGE